jgi:hypothetical protein
MDRALLKAKVRGRDRVVLLCQMDNEPMRRLARSAGLHATVDDGEITGTLDLPQAGLAEVTEDATRDAVGNATYAMLLTARTWVDLFGNHAACMTQRAESAKAPEGEGHPGVEPA